MADTELPISEGFYRSRSLPIQAQDCINWYAGSVEQRGFSQKALIGTPGLHQLATTGEIEQVNRGSHDKGGIPYFVNGDQLYRLNRTITDGVASFDLESLGGIPGRGRVSMHHNTTQLFTLVPGNPSRGFIFNEDAGTPFEEIVDPDFLANGNPTFVTYIDGYFALTTDEDKFIISALNDGLSYDALDFAAAEVDPDGIVAPIVLNNQLFIAGSETIEVFQNVPQGSGFPFQRIEGFVLQTGVRAGFSLVEGSETFYFIGGGDNEEPVIQRFTGNNTEIISPDGVIAILSEFTDEEIADAFAFSYSQDGSRFVCFAVGNTTLVFDAASGEWHERRSNVPVPGEGDPSNVRWRVNSLVQAYGKIIVGDSQDGRVGELSPDFFDEYDREIIREVPGLILTNTSNPLSFPRLELTMESGVGDAQTPDPKIRMQFSADAKRFSDPITRRIGKEGEYNHRIIWRRLGRFARMALFRFTMSDKVKPIIYKLEADVV